MPRRLRAVLVVSLESWLQDRIRPCRRYRLPEIVGKCEAMAEGLVHDELAPGTPGESFCSSLCGYIFDSPVSQQSGGGA